MTPPSVTVVVFASTQEEAVLLLTELHDQSYPENALDILLMTPASISSSSLPSQFKLQATVRTLRHAADVNQALALSQSDYIAFADTSLKMDVGWIAALIKEMKSSWRIVGVTPKILVSGKKIAGVGAGLGTRYRWYDRGSSEEDEGQYDENREVYFLNLLGSMLDRNYIRTTSGLDEDFTTTYADIDLSVRIVAAGYRLRFTPGAILLRPEGGPGWDRNSQPLSPHAEWERLFIIAKHYPDVLPTQVAAAAPLLANSAHPEQYLAKLLDKWVANASDRDSRNHLLQSILEDPTHLHDHLQREWLRRTRDA
jgi:hypothetical protein